MPQPASQSLAPAATGYALETLDLRKVYPGTVALDSVSVGFRAGEVHAIIGKNGAGKSSLVRMLAGASTPTSGTILLNGQAVQLRSPRDAQRKGIAMVHQELSLVHGMTVAENILLGRWITRLGGLCVDRRAIAAEAQRVLNEIQVDLDVNAMVGSLPVGTRQVVEIAKAIACDPRVLILDEPTSALSREEASHLLALIRGLAENGLTILYISHRMQELQDVADRITVLRDAKLVGTIPIAEASPGVIAKMMFGDTPLKGTPPVFAREKKPLLTVRGLGARDRYRGVDLTVHQGETVGIAGMVGSGRTELLRALAGADPFDAGTIELSGKAVTAAQARRRPRTLMDLGIALIPEDRKHQGLAVSLSAADNVCMASWRRLARWGTVSPARRREVTHEAVNALDIKVANIDRPVSRLSGGNQQKVVVAKWLQTQPSVILFDEPTRGIDIQAKQQIFQLVSKLNGEGVGALFVSSELEELFEVCHRVLIMRNGRIVDEVKPAEITVRELFQRCLSTSHDESPEKESA